MASFFTFLALLANFKVDSYIDIHIGALIKLMELPIR